MIVDILSNKKLQKIVSNNYLLEVESEPFILFLLQSLILLYQKI